MSSFTEDLVPFLLSSSPCFYFCHKRLLRVYSFKDWLKNCFCPFFAFKCDFCSNYKSGPWRHRSRLGHLNSETTRTCVPCWKRSFLFCKGPQRSFGQIPWLEDRSPRPEEGPAIRGRACWLPWPVVRPLLLWASWSAGDLPFWGGSIPWLVLDSYSRQFMLIVKMLPD